MNEPARKTSASSNTLWTEEELRHAVDVYVLLLRMQVHGMGQKAEPVAQALLSGPLALRNDAAIRYRMRNISAVAKELGGPTVNGFSPAESVGSNVRPRIRAMLIEHVDFNRILNVSPGAPNLERRDSLIALAVLREGIENLQEEFAWIGHNNPPHEANLFELEREWFQQALSDIDSIRSELEKPDPVPLTVELSNSRLVDFGLQLARWIGGRTTKFVDAALVIAASVVVAKVSGLLPALIDAVEAVARTLGH